MTYIANDVLHEAMDVAIEVLAPVRNATSRKKREDAAVIIARAIMAERKRCAALVDTWPIMLGETMDITSPQDVYAYVSARDEAIATAIDAKVKHD